MMYMGLLLLHWFHCQDAHDALLGSAGRIEPDDRVRLGLLLPPAGVQVITGQHALATTPAAVQDAHPVALLGARREPAR
jgi:hypothetical protein